MEAIVLAGGLGTRLRSTVPDLPKPMAPIDGRPFLEHFLDYWIDEGMNHIILSVGYRASSIIDHFGKSYRGIPIDYSVEEQPLGTGGALLQAKTYLQGANPFLLLNGDTFFGVRLKEMVEFHNHRGAHATFSLLEKESAERYGQVALTPSFQIQSWDKGGSYINGGVYYLEKFLVEEELPIGALSFEKKIVPIWLEKDEKIYGFVSNGPFIDIGIPDDYFRASKILKTNPRKLL